MSNEEPVSAFRSALTAASGHIIGSAFPQFGAMMDRMRDQDNKKDRDKASKASKSSSGGRRGRLSSSAIQVIDEGFDELHGDLQVTNIILNSSLEEHRRISGLLEKMLLSGGGGGGGGSINTAADMGIGAALAGFGTKLLGGIAASITALGPAIAYYFQEDIKKGVIDPALKLVLGPPGKDVRTHDYVNKYGPLAEIADDVVNLKKDLGFKNTTDADPVTTENTKTIAALTEQIKQLTDLEKLKGRDTTHTKELDDKIKELEDQKKKLQEGLDKQQEDSKREMMNASGQTGRGNLFPDRAIADVALPKSPDDRSNPNPLQPTFDDQGVDAANSRLTPGVADIKRKMSGQPTIQEKVGSPLSSPFKSTSTPYEAKSITDTMGISSEQYKAYEEGVTDLEGKKYGVMGGAGHRFAGRYQMGPDEITQTARELGVARPSNEEFLSNPEMQEKFMERYTIDHYNYLMKHSPKFASLSKEDQLGILGYAHNQGAGGRQGQVVGASAYLQEGGGSGHDAFGTAGSSYISAVKRRLAQLDNTNSDKTKDAESESGKKQALLAAGTNDWGDSNKSYAGVKNSLQALKDKGYDPILVLPNKSVHGSSAAYDGALKAATELGVKTEYPSSFETGSESYHIAPKGVAEIKAKYPGVPAFGDSNGDRLGATEGITGFQGKGAEEIAGHLKNIAAVAVKQDQRVVDSSNFRPVNDQAFRKIANYIDSKNITAGFKDGPLNVNNRLDSPALDFSSYQPDNLAPYIQQTGIDNAAKTVSNRGSNSVKALFTDHTNKSGSPDERSHKDKNNAGSVAPPDERLKKLFDNYIVGTHR